MLRIVGWSVLCLASSQAALADDLFADRGRVISVTPQVERINQPRQECRTEYVRERVYESSSRSNTGAVLGGVTGGLLGSTIGRGSGRIAAAAVGAGLGALVGDRVDNRDLGGREKIITRPVEECFTVDQWSSVTTGYLVSYEYQGRQYSTVMDRDPGNHIDLDVSVRPRQAAYQNSYRPASYPAAVRPGYRGHGRHRDYW